METIKTSLVKPSDNNPRGKIDQKAPAFLELVASVREKGVLMPILVRRGPGGSYLIIAGHRRHAAAQAADLKEIPARVVQMTDVEAAEAAIVENLQREDIHPLEEGMAYRKLMEESKYELEDVAKKVGKSVAFVRDRLVLTDLIPSAQKAFRAGDFLIGHASLLARLDEKLQAEALKEHLKPNSYDGSITTIDEFREWIRVRTFQENMKEPPWKGDAEMQAALGGCEECGGKGGDLFGKKAAETCTNPKCYANRLAAYIAIQMQKDPKLVKLSGDYRNDEDIIGSNAYKEILGKKDKCDHVERGIVVQGYGQVGRILNFCRAPECDKHWATRAPGGHYKPSAKERAERKKQLQAQRTKKANQDKAIIKAISKVKMPLSEKHLDILFDVVFRRFGYSYLQPIAARYGIKAEKKERNGYSHRDLETPLKKFFASKGKNGKLQFIFEVGIEATGASGDNAFIKKL